MFKVHKLVFLLTLVFLQSCGLNPRINLEDDLVAADSLRSSIGDGEQTPDTPVVVIQDNIEDWQYGGNSVVVPMSSGSNLTVDADDNTNFPNMLESHPEGEGWSTRKGLSIFAKVSLADSNLNTLMSWCVQGTDSLGRDYTYCVRTCRSRTEVYFEGPGKFVKKIQNGFISGEEYKVNFLFYKDAIAVFFSHESYKRWNPNHVIYLPIDENSVETKTRFTASIKEGTGFINDVNITRHQNYTETPSIDQDIPKFETDPVITTLVSKEVDLADKWTYYQQVPQTRSKFYRTFYGFDAYQKTYQGSFFEWSGSVWGGNVKVPRDTGKVIKWNFKTTSLDKFYARFRVFGRNASNSARYQDLLFNQRNVNFWTYLNDPALSSEERVEGRRILNNLEPDTEYNIEYFMYDGIGSSLYLYKASEPRPAKPFQILLTDKWDFNTRFQIYRGAVTDLTQEILTGSAAGVDLSGTAFTAYLSQFMEDRDVYKTEFITADQQSHLVSYRDSAEKSTAQDDHYVYTYADRIEMKSNGTRYMKYSGPEVFNRATGVKKGMKMKIKFHNPEFDPIMIVAAEGRAPGKGYLRYGNVFRKSHAYVQHRAFRPFNWGSWRIAAKSTNQTLYPQNYPLNFGYDIAQNEYYVKIEPHSDGYGMWFWPANETAPTEPIHVLKINDAESLRHAMWIYRGHATVSDISYYDITHTLDTIYTFGNAEKTFITAEQTIFNRASVETVVDDGGSDSNLTTFNPTTNIYQMRGNNQNYAVHYSHKDIIFRDREATLTFKVKAQKPADKPYTGFTLGLHGTAYYDPTHRRYRRHVLRFWENDIYAETYGSGIHAYSGHKILSYTDGSWYNVEMKIAKTGTHLTIWEDGQSKPSSPQSVFFLSDWDARFVSWIRNGVGEIKDLVMDIKDSPDLSRYIPTFGNALNYMGASFNPHEFANVISGGNQNVVVNKDISASNAGCFYNLSDEFYSQSGGVHYFKSDAARYWDGFTCTRPIERSAQGSTKVEFSTEDDLQPGSQFLLGFIANANTNALAGSGHRTYRRFALRLTPGTGSSVNAAFQIFTHSLGWTTSQSSVTLNKNEIYELELMARKTGTEAKLVKKSDGTVLIEEKLEDYLVSDQAYESYDFTPYLFMRTLKDTLKIHNMSFQ